jgi:hypothetical protein
MRPCPEAGWCEEGDAFDRLREVLRVLARHGDAQELRRAAARRVVGWQIRVDRSTAEVGEDGETLAPGAEPRRERRVYRLQRRGESWTVEDGM